MMIIWRSALKLVLRVKTQVPKYDAYEQLADAYSHAKDEVFVARADADGVGKGFGQKYVYVVPDS